MSRILERPASIAAPAPFPEICLAAQKAVPIPRLFIWSFIFGALQKTSEELHSFCQISDYQISYFTHLRL
ncbi:hypothetical protein DFS30_07300 [Akkermansia muciniphila]|nr:hypothetical protein CXT98_02780 [Akkermansia muciniphila]QAA39119.1 hypothetical protein C1I90_07630 [Akkermansia muciniphila]QAA64550.1 hypothetical protein C1O60_07465 [Akkermansia muciniphila]QAA66811.1 hypothetical protein C1O61_07555 [Akkermansia muciniphila]QAA69069.1 hypothetical protein C1O62_07515 [Akkermansia muciniphila]